MCVHGMNPNIITCSELFIFPLEFMSATLSITSNSRKTLQTSQESAEWQVCNWLDFQSNNWDAGN